MCSVVDHFPLAKLLCSHVCTFRVLITLIMSRDLITNINLTLIYVYAVIALDAEIKLLYFTVNSYVINQLKR